MKKILAGLCLLLLSSGLIMAMGTGEGTATKKNYSFGGSTTVEPIINSAIEEFTKAHPELSLSYESQGSSAGVTGVIEGIYSLAGSSREVTDAEIAKGANPIAIAIDGIVVAVNGNVPLENLDFDKVAAIFAGEIKNWKELGGPDAAIVVINRDEASGTRASFLELVLHKKIGKQAKFIADAVIVKSNGDMVTKIGTTPYAIGYCGFGYVEKVRDAGGKTITINQVQPTEENIKNGKFPISRKLYVVTRGAPQPGTLEKQFIDYLLSQEGQDIVEEESFIGL